MIYNIDYFREVEEKIVIEESIRIFSMGSSEFVAPTDKQINDVYRSIHKRMVNTLISYYMEVCCKDYMPSMFSQLFEGELEIIDIIPDGIDVTAIPQICESLHVSYLNCIFVYSHNRILRKKSKSNLLESGAVYTKDRIAYDIVYRTISNVKLSDSNKIRVLDFATGTGRFYRQIINCLDSIFGISSDDSVLNNIFAIDVDPVAINICRLNALSYLSSIDIEKANIIASHIILKNGLLKEELFENSTAISRRDLNGLFFNGFHAIVSNPPYLVLKPNKNKMDTETIDNINNILKYFRNSSDYKYSIEGMLNLYKLSLEAMIGMLQKGGEMGIICPSTLFADISASSLRKYFLAKNTVTYIKYFSEKDPLFENVTQATCIFHLTKGGSSKQIDIVQGDNTYVISLEDVKYMFSSNWEIPPIEKIEWDILKKLICVTTLKKQSFIRNKRGELDLSLHKEYITSQPTNLRLVRGNMISKDKLVNINNEYVLTDFIKRKSNDYIENDYGKKRLICQQISNQTQKIRLGFVLCENNDILGNSCNYITVEDELIPKMSMLLNSALLNWRFKITSTNNHINNYELDELPIIDINKIHDEVLTLMGEERDRKICELYGLQDNEIEYIISQHYDIA